MSSSNSAKPYPPEICLRAPEAETRDPRVITVSGGVYELSPGTMQGFLRLEMGLLLISGLVLQVKAPGSDSLE